MSTIGGLSGSTSSSIRGYGGLASGLDRDTLIEQATAGTTKKIENKQKEKQKLEWEQEAIRGIVDKLVGFTQTFASYASQKNLIGSALYGDSTITALGSNSNKVSVKGSSALTKSMSITAVKQLAQNAQLNFLGNASKQEISSGAVGSLSDLRDFNVIANSGMTVKYGTKYYTVNLPESGDGYSYNNAQEVADSLQKAFKQVSIGGGRTLSDVLSVQQENGRFTLYNTDTSGNNVSLSGQRNGLLDNLGFVPSGLTLSTMPQENLNVSAGGLTAYNNATLTEKKTAAGVLGGKTIAFTYNGKTENITLPSGEELMNNGEEKIRNELQTKLDKAFGKGRIAVTYDANGLSFKTTKPGGGADDSSVLEITGVDRGIFGKYGVFSGINNGDSNRLNLKVGFLDSGMKHDVTDADMERWMLEKPLVINGVEIEVDKNDTLQQIMDKVNASDAGVKMDYLKEADRFVMTSTHNGESGEVNVSGVLADMLFGKATTYKDDGTVDVQGDYDIQKGQDAIMEMTYSGSGAPVIVTRDSNSFSLNGLDFTLKGKFDSNEADSDPITFESSVNSQPAADAMREMVDMYNEIIKLVNDEVSTKPNRKYEPLTAEEEADLTENQIKAWTDKAKAGLLFNDVDIRGLATSLRTVVSENATELEKMGISVSSTYTDNGKLIFNEVAFKQALEDDPDAVKKAFAGSPVTDEDGNTVSQGGLVVRMKNIMDKYAITTGSTKGILIERAGSSHAPASILTNTIQKQLDKIDDQIDDLLDRLETEQDRYIKQFTTLEQLVSQMNSQSSWLASAFGG